MFRRLTLMPDKNFDFGQQNYEDVIGFQSLRSCLQKKSFFRKADFKCFDIFVNMKSLSLQSRTTAFSCSKESEQYDENILKDRPLPWVVRVIFQSRNSLKGILCSGCIMMFE